MNGFPRSSVRRNYWITSLCLVIFLLACNKPHHTISRGFYYWKTSFLLSPYEQERLKQAGCKRMYVRCFDVDWDMKNQQAKPVAVLRKAGTSPIGFDYVPVVFITQQAISKVTRKQLPELAANMAKLMATVCAEQGFAPSELQLDCDWTQRTRDTYFELLKLLKGTAFFTDKTLSCTVRLHQVKYRLRSGIPPVDRGLIMCYNVGDLKKPGDHNSILDVPLAKDYLQHLDSYPLPVDVALPLYSWCLQFRDGKMIGILRGIEPEAMNNPALFYLKKGNLYACAKDTTWEGYSLLRGDEIRVERPAVADLKELAHYTALKVRNERLSILFFHADSLTLSKYSTHDLEATYSAYH